MLLSLNFGEKFHEKVFIFTLCLVSLFLFYEVIFRLSYRLYHGFSYSKEKRVNLEKLYVEPHPYIPFVMKPHSLLEDSGAMNLPLHKERFTSGNFKSNKHGFLNGVNGDREMLTPKPKGLVRINCIGASTTGNYIVENDKKYSYPLELEKILKSKLSKRIEVNNCGQGGYNSADILARTIFQILDTKPDIMILYHGYNDIRSYLTPDFKSDYSHSRCNLGENYWKFGLTGKIPDFNLKFVDYLISKCLAGSVRNSLLDHIVRGKFDEKADPSNGLMTYKRNIQYLIDLCNANGVELILSTYCHFLYEKIKNENLHLTFHSIVNKENEIIRGLAKKNNLILIDNSILVPADEEYFVDSIHFLKGMKLLAKNIADVILKNQNYLFKM